ncbi:MAG: NERD domain-containing protein [Candidatus Hydrogenedentes bacterium]|nr:NERD domain-containing protein [Candidatus Hydrogenedentota bacterium]
MKQKKETRSPLKNKPLRYPAQSLDEEINRILTDEVFLWLLIPAIFAALTLQEWFRYFFSVQLHPLIFTIVTVGIIAFSVRKVFLIHRKLKSLKLGRDGEREVGQYLDLLVEQGCRVFHDLVGDNFNVDHVVISPHGIFTVETKTHSKPLQKESIVKLQKGKLLIDGYISDRDYLKQAKAQAHWVKTILRESTGKDFSVKPAIVFPGWFVEPMPKDEDRSVWVLNPKILPIFIENEVEVLDRHDVMLAAFHLSRYIRTTI